MAQESLLPEFTFDQEIAAFLASCELLSRAWKESLRVCENSSQNFILSEDEDEHVVYVAFPSFQRIEDFIVKGSEYGEGNIQIGNEIFSGCLKGNDDQPARVHQGALKLFLHIMENTDLEAKIRMQGKPIIFVGHFLGGSVATLATLWLLGKRLKQSSPFCITFGCPLVGDKRLVEAVDRENWVGNFCHVVSKHDIVPRILVDAKKDVSDYFNQSNHDVYATLVQTLKGLDGVNNGSPYRPFGAYMFCSNHGAACIQNSDTVLEMFHLIMQSQKNSSQETLQEHINYGSVLKDVVENSMQGTRIAICNSESSYKMGISLVSEAIGVGDQNEPARIALETAGQIENRYNTFASHLAIELSRLQGSMAKLEWYKELCEKEGIGYYDCFKEHANKRDIEANKCRGKLATFWDEIIAMWKNHELPNDFQSRKKWTYAGNTYSRLVEPLDIAHCYRISRGNGNYLSDGRLERHEVLQKWFEENEKTRRTEARTRLASLTVDSCFWAYVEEALKDLKQNEHQKLKSLEKFEDYVTRMIQDRSISSDAFLKGSSFMSWWQEYKQIQSPEWKSSSQLNKIMESESWKG